MATDPTDHWPDYRWKHPDSTDEEYAARPWAHSQDVQQSFFGTRFNKRREFVENLAPHRRDRIEHELERISKARQRFSADNDKKALVAKMENTLREWRRCVATSEEAMMEEITEKSLLRRQYNSSRHQREREILRRCTASKPLSGEAADRPTVIYGQAKHQVSLPEAENSTGAKTQSLQALKSPPIQEVQDEKNDEPEPYWGLEASVMYFRRVKNDEDSAWRGWTYDHSSFEGTMFPNQKIAMHKILGDNDTENPLMEPCPTSLIRYFHFPANNMQWIEMAIARYYNEEPRPLDDEHVYNQYGRKTDRLLSREFWRGQMQGNLAYGSTPGTQLKRPLSLGEHWTRNASDPAIHPSHRQDSTSPVLPKDQTMSESNPIPGREYSQDKNVAIFLKLPYLHWETMSCRAKMVDAINDTIGHKKKDPALLDVVKRMRETRIGREAHKPHPWRSLLGVYLLTLARVAEQMAYAADERLLRYFVKADPPLHIRRTLDQSYFVNGDDPGQRDANQVVYRSTMAKKGDSLAQPRVVMVDQLWLWILDNNTIITSYPRRWGSITPDPSDVHKSICQRFESQPEDVNSVQHLALMIIDQCSRVFFDRAKPLDQRPEVMNIISSAIAYTDQMTADAYDTFWDRTKLYNTNMFPKDFGSIYMNIDHEGALLKEAQHIAEELKVMRRIYNEQIKVIQDFRTHLIHPRGRQSGRLDTTSQLQKLLQELINSEHGWEKESQEAHDDAETPSGKPSQIYNQTANETLHEAEGVLNLVRTRRVEIIELEQSATQACRQLKDLLSLKQQQASIVEAKSALERAKESVKQGRAIMAFTIVTIFFLPLGFFAAFFGMNNQEINEAKWMTLNDQIKYMFSLSTIVIVLSTSMAFYPSIRSYTVTIRDLIDDKIGAYGEASKKRQMEKLLQEVQTRIDKRDDDLRSPPNLQEKQDNLGDPLSTVKFMEVLAWLPKGSLRVPEKDANDFLPR